MILRCPECEHDGMMRAVKVVRFHLRAGLSAMLFGPWREEIVGINAACANPACGCAMRIDRSGVMRLRTKPRETASNGVVIPPEPTKPKPDMQLHRTPGMEWTRDAR